MLVLAACAVLAGARSFTAIAEHARDVGAGVLVELADRLAIDPEHAALVVPHESTIRRLLQQLDPAALEAARGSWTSAQLGTRPTGVDRPRREQRPVWALDGKTVRGARTPDGLPHLVSVIDQASGVVLAQTQVPAKAAELTAAVTVLSGLDLHGVVVTADALHTQRTHADYLYERGGHYVMTVKANQPGLLARLRRIPWSAVGPCTQQRARGHGRIETRTISVVALDPCPDGGGEFFPHAAQAIRVIRRRRPLRPGGRWRVVTVYAITSLGGADADPALLAGWIRGHWGIENRLHWVRDVSFDEDRSAVRTGAGPQTMAALRNLAITALRLDGVTNIAAALRHHARDASRALHTYKIT
ncbi:ISAs1 family transposase [Pseudonocardia sp. HH130630-07]|uniref:ISAs1 family transposase n=2 Tax=Pseudonocardia sp. HH130630-07 TaxID=1690815 RepID=UPI000A798A51|nr:ISAs1 family transposase [Pseudonocardia sp. HH130630-07]